VHESSLAGYLDGLRTEDVDASEHEVHLGYVGSLLLRAPFIGLPLELLRRSGQPDLADVFARRARYTRYLLDLRRESGFR
jgi:hypothetical protein